MPKKDNNQKSGAARRNKERKHLEAVERQARYDRLTPAQKMEQIANRRGESKREANKLLSLLA
jgi:hypothetical protein